MQIANDYAAESIAPFSAWYSIQARPDRSRASAGDVVSISDEARAACGNASGDTASAGAGAEAAKKPLAAQFHEAAIAWKRQPLNAYAVQEQLFSREAGDTAGPEQTRADASVLFRKQFNGWRGNGIFAGQKETDASDLEPASGNAGDTTDAMSRKASEIERKIKDLVDRLSTVMASNLPETEKEAMSGQIQKDIEELQSQLTAYKQAQKAASEA